MGRPIIHYEIPANDVERLKRFYEECFGWKFTNANMPGVEYWLFSTGKRNDLGGGLYKKQAQEGPRNYVHVESVDAAIVTFQRAGGSIVMQKQDVPGVGFVAIGLDPEGNAVGLYQPLSPSRKASRRRKPKRTKRRKR